MFAQRLWNPFLRGARSGVPQGRALWLPGVPPNQPGAMRKFFFVFSQAAGGAALPVLAPLSL